jgi:hypothetical protein
MASPLLLPLSWFCPNLCERAQDDCDVRKWQILLQKDFAHLGEQHSLKVRRACATLIQKSIRPDSIVARFYSTASSR